MVRTRADNGGRKAVGSKAPRKNLSSGGGSSSSSNDSGSTGGFGLVNHAKMWPAPTWQKGIGSFFQKSQKQSGEDSGTCSSSASLSNSSSPTSGSQRMETEEVVIGDSNINSPTENRESLNERVTEKIEETLSSAEVSPSSPSNGKQKQKWKFEVSSKKKRRVVLADSSDEDE